MAIPKWLKNVATFGASGRIERRHEQYMSVFHFAEQKHAEFNSEMSISLEDLAKLAYQRVLAAEQLSLYQEEYERIKNNHPELNYFSGGYLKRHKSIDVGFSFENIALNTIKGVSSGAIIGLGVVTAPFVQSIISAKLAATVGGTKLAMVSTALNSNVFLSGLGIGKLGTIGTAAGLKAGGVGLAGKVGLGAAVPIAVPFMLVGMALYSHRDANSQIRKMNEEEVKLNQSIAENTNRIVICKKIQASCNDKLTSITYLQSLLPELFNTFKKTSTQAFADKKTIAKWWMKICLFLRLPNSGLSALRLHKLELENNVMKIHNLIKITVA